MALAAASLLRGGIALALAVAGIYASAQGMMVRSLAIQPRPVIFQPLGDTPSGQANAAKLALAAGHPAQAIAPAARSLALRPVNPGILRILALARLGTGDEAGASQALTLASQLGWRDAETQSLLMTIAMSSGDARAAAIRLDALARQKVQPAQMSRAMKAILMLPGGPDALAQRLADNPAWRNDYLQATDSLPSRGYASWMAMLAQLQRLGAPARPAEISAFERTLLTKSQVLLAIKASARFGVLHGARSDGLGEIAQGNDISPFVWAVAQGREAAVSQQAPGSLTVAADGQTGGPVVVRVFPVKAGAHSLSARLTSSGDGEDRAFRWTVSCLPSGAWVDPELSPAATGAARLDRIAFATPASCAAVKIALVSISGLIPRDYAITLSDLRLD